jgi:hypothetical protein
MSGSDGPSAPKWNDNGASGPVGDDCSQVVYDGWVDAPLESEPFATGAVYPLTLSTETPPTILLLNSDGSAVGAVHPYPPLRRCLANGAAFRAVVTSANGAEIGIHVEIDE